MNKLLRPGSNFHRAEDLPTRPDPAQSKAVETLPYGFELEYDRTSAAAVKERYSNDPVYRSRVDILIERRSQNNANS
jgi:hypothetical protein